MFKRSTFSWPLLGCVEVDTDFKTSSHCPPFGGCVEVKRQERTVVIRDSKNPEGSPLVVSYEVWRAFTRGVKAGEFDV